MTDKDTKPKTGADRMLEAKPINWGRNKDWNEGLMKAELKKQIIARLKK